MEPQEMDWPQQCLICIPSGQPLHDGYLVLYYAPSRVDDVVPVPFIKISTRVYEIILLRNVHSVYIQISRSNF